MPPPATSSPRIERFAGGASLVLALLLGGILWFVAAHPRLAVRLDRRILYSIDDTRGCLGECALSTPRLFLWYQPRPIPAVWMGAATRLGGLLGLPVRVSVRGANLLLAAGATVLALAGLRFLGASAPVSLAVLWVFCTSPLFLLMAVSGYEVMTATFLLTFLFTAEIARSSSPGRGGGEGGPREGGAWGKGGTVAAALLPLVRVELAAASLVALARRVRQRRLKEALLIPLPQGAFTLLAWRTLGHPVEGVLGMMNPIDFPAPLRGGTFLQGLSRTSESFGLPLLALAGWGLYAGIRSARTRGAVPLVLAPIAALLAAGLLSSYTPPAGRYFPPYLPPLAILSGLALDRTLGRIRSSLRLPLLALGVLVGLAGNARILFVGLPPQSSAHLMEVPGGGTWFEDADETARRFRAIEELVAAENPRTLWVTWDLYNPSMECNCSLWSRPGLVYGPPPFALPADFVRRFGPAPYLEIETLRVVRGGPPPGPGLLLTRSPLAGALLRWPLVAEFPPDLRLYRIPAPTKLPPRP